MAENVIPQTDQAMRPDEVMQYGGIEVAIWGGLFVPAGEKLDPVPAVYSSADCIEMTDMRMDLATAEALVVRLQTAIAYERAKATTSPTAVVSK